MNVHKWLTISLGLSLITAVAFAHECPSTIWQHKTQRIVSPPVGKTSTFIVKDDDLRYGVYANKFVCENALDQWAEDMERIGYTIKHFKDETTNVYLATKDGRYNRTIVGRECVETQIQYDIETTNRDRP